MPAVPAMLTLPAMPSAVRTVLSLISGISAATVGRIVRAILVIAALAAITTTVVLWAQGYRMYVVHTGSMSPTYRPGDVVIDKPAQSHYHAGQIITFRHSDATTDVVTHRITEITKAGLIHTKGDANRTPDVWNIRPDQVKGSAAVSVAHGGYLLVFLHQPAGDAAVVTAALGIMLLWKVFFPEETPVPAAPDVPHDLDQTPVPDDAVDEDTDELVDDDDDELSAEWPLDALLTLI